MNDKLKTEFQDLMTASLQDALAQAECELPNETIYAIVIYPASGFHGLTVAVNTKEQFSTSLSNGCGLDDELAVMLKDHPDLQALAEQASSADSEVTASEWPHVFSELPQLDRIEDIVDEAYAVFHEAESLQESIADWFSSAVAAAVNSFASKLLDRDNILLGLQFSDANGDELALVESVSQRVNSKHWHSKVQSMCKAMRESQKNRD